MKPLSGQYPRLRAALRAERLPCAFVDLDAFDRNVAYVATAAHGTDKTIRIHSKSLRCAALIQRALERGGPAFRGVMTYSMEETEHLAAQGLDDFIVAYPTVQPSDLERLVAMVDRGVTVRPMIDSVAHLRVLSEVARSAGVLLSVCLEVDLSFRPVGPRLHLGLRRSPIRTAVQARHVAEEAPRHPHVRVDAVMGYEAHIAGPNDDVPGKWLQNTVIGALKQASVAELTRRRGRVVAELRRAALPIEIVNGGGSGSLRSTLADPCVTEVTVGSAFYAPGLFWHYRDVSFEPSAFFAVQVVRRPASDLVTCLGGGYVASGPAGDDKLPVPVYPEGLRLLSMEGAGEVQTPLLLPPGAPTLQLGDPVIFQHAKAGELTERFNELLLVRDDRVVDRVPTYRGEGFAFL